MIPVVDISPAGDLSNLAASSNLEEEYPCSRFESHIIPTMDLC